MSSNNNNSGYLKAYNIFKTSFKFSVIIFILWNFIAYKFIHNEGFELQDVSKTFSEKPTRYYERENLIMITRCYYEQTHPHSLGKTLS